MSEVARDQSPVSSQRSHDRFVGTIVAAILLGFFEFILRPGIGYGHSRWTGPGVDWRIAETVRAIVAALFALLFVLCLIRLARSRPLWPRAAAVLITAVFASAAVIIAFSAWEDFDPCRGRGGLCHPVFYLYLSMSVVYTSAFAFATSAMVYAVARWRGVVVVVSALAILIPAALLVAGKVALESATPSRSALTIWALFLFSAAASIIASSWLRCRLSQTQEATLS